MKKRGCFRYKKAQADVNEEVLFFLGEIFLIGVTLLILLAWVNSIRDNTLFEKNYLARDTALLIDSIYSAPGNVNFVYSFDTVELSKFKFGFRQQRANVVEEQGEQIIKFPYADDLISFSPLNLININAEELTFIKTGNEFRVGENMKGNLDKIICPDVNTLKEENVYVLTDPGHGKPDFGFVNEENGLKESEITTGIAKAIDVFASEENIYFDFTREVDYDSEKSMEERLEMIEEKPSHIFISIHVGSDEDKNINHVKAFVPSDYNKKSVKLACKIVNSLLDRYDDITGASIIPSEEEILNKNEVSVLLELGNIQADKEITIRYGDTALSIIGGIKDYFE